MWIHKKALTPLPVANSNRVRINNGRTALYVLGGIVFAFLVWPTPWQYDKSGRILVRTERFTGEVQTLSSTEWETRNSGWLYKWWHRNDPKSVVVASSQPPINAQDIDSAISSHFTEDELSYVSIDKLSLDQGHFVAMVYNGSQKKIASITVQVVISRNGDSNFFRRSYRFIGDTPIDAQQEGQLLSNFGFTLEPNQKIEKSQVLDAVSAP